MHQPFTGSYGSLPLPVRAICDELTDEAESSPDRFLRVDYIGYVNRVRERLANLIGAQTDECVMVNNASLGLATILRNLIFNEGDILVGGVATNLTLFWVLFVCSATTTYGSVYKSLKCLADVPPYPSLSTLNIQFPTKRDKIIQDFEKHIKEVTEVRDITGKRKIVAIIDSVAAFPAVLLSWKETVAICQEAGVISIVDGAHSICQELDINLSEAQPDFWVSVCPLYLLRITVTIPLFPKNFHK